MEKVASWEATARAVGLFMGHSADAVNKVIDALKGPLLERVSHEAYDLRVVRRKLYAMLRKSHTTGKYMQMLDEMTV